MEHLAPVLALFHGKWNRLEHPIKKPAKSQQKQSVPLEHRSLRRGISKPLISGVPFHRGYYSKRVEHPRAGQAWPCPSRRGQIGPRERSAGHVSRSVKSERAMSSRRARHELEPAPLRQGIYASQSPGRRDGSRVYSRGSFCESVGKPNVVNETRPLAERSGTESRSFPARCVLRNSTIPYGREKPPEQTRGSSLRFQFAHVDPQLVHAIL